MLIKGEFLATINISLYLPLQCNTKLHPALKAWVVFFDIEYFKAFIDISSVNIKFLNPISISTALDIEHINKQI